MADIPVPSLPDGTGDINSRIMAVQSDDTLQLVPIWPEPTGDPDPRYATDEQGALADTAVQPAAIVNMVTSLDLFVIDQMTQAEYDAITPDPNTLYVIVG